MIGRRYIPDKGTELKYSIQFMYLDPADIDNLLTTRIPDKCLATFDILVTDYADHQCKLVHHNDYLNRNSPHHFEPDINFFGPDKDKTWFAIDEEKIETCIRKVANFDKNYWNSYIHFDIKKPWLTFQDIQTLYDEYREMFPKVVLEQAALSDVPLPNTSKLIATIPLEKIFGIHVNPKE